MNAYYRICSLGVVRTLLTLGLFVISWYLLVVRMMWLYDSPVLWWAYQVEHFILFSLGVLYFFFICRHAVLISLVLSILIGLIPYELWFSFLLKDFDANLLSDFTRSLPGFLRVIIEVGFYPVVQFLLLIATWFIINRKVSHVSPRKN